MNIERVEEFVNTIVSTPSAFTSFADKDLLYRTSVGCPLDLRSRLVEGLRKVFLDQTNPARSSSPLFSLSPFLLVLFPNSGFSLCDRLQMLLEL